MEALATFVDPMSQSDLVKAFAAFDVNGDGTITLEEFTALMVRPSSQGASPITAEAFGGS